MIGIACVTDADTSPAPRIKLEVVAGSLRFHRVRAIRTEADTYQSLHDLYLSDVTRRQLGLSVRAQLEP